MSRTYHHSWRYREALSLAKKVPWWKLADCPTGWVKRQWAGEVRRHLKQEMLRNPEDPVLTNPRRITDIWNWY